MPIQLIFYKACARLAKAFGMSIIASLRNPHIASQLADVVYADLGELMAQSNFVGNVLQALEELLINVYVMSIVSSLPLTAHTKHIIGAAAFSRSKPGQIFINVGKFEHAC